MSGALCVLNPRVVGWMSQKYQFNSSQDFFFHGNGLNRSVCGHGRHWELEIKLPRPTLQRCGGCLEKRGKACTRRGLNVIARVGEVGVASVSVVEPSPSEPPTVIAVNTSVGNANGAEGPDLTEVLGGAEDWPAFAKAVSGEWDGVGADFEPSGEARELPERVVPDAFREWDVQLWDWQTQCPTLAEPEKVGVISFKDIRLLPTVGCEADAATRYSAVERQLGSKLDAGAGEALAVRRDGAYCVATWHSSSQAAAVSDVQLRVEHCLVHTLAQGARLRTRCVQTFELWSEELGPSSTLEEGMLTVVNERWDGPFSNGEVFGGCGASASPSFAGGARLDLASLAADSWQQLEEATVLGRQGGATMVAYPPKAVRLGELLEGAVALPGKHWKRVGKLEEGGGVNLEVGWMADSETVLVSSAHLRWYSGLLQLQGVKMVTYKKDTKLEAS